MKKVTRSIIHLLIGAMILTVALSVVATAQNQVPFNGSMQGHDTDTPGPSPLEVVVTTSYEGFGTHLGHFSLNQELTLNYATLTATGSGQWTAANGDSIYTTIYASGEPTENPEVFRITEIHTVTAGTGRFVGVQGSFTVERFANAVTFLTFGSFHGTITSPGASH